MSPASGNRDAKRPSPIATELDSHLQFIYTPGVIFIPIWRNMHRKLDMKPIAETKIFNWQR